MKKMFITIGEMSKLSGVSSHTLRYYDKANILKPEIRDENNGYRYYTASQFPVLDMIVHLRSLDFSIEFIKEHFDKLDYGYTLDLIEKRISENKKEIEKLIEIEKKLEMQKQYFTSLLKADKILYKPFLEDCEEMRGIFIEKISDKEEENMIYFFNKINEIFGDMNLRHEFSVGLIIDKNNFKNRNLKNDKFVIFREKKSCKNTYIMEKGRYACMYEKGAPIADESIELFLKWIKDNNYEAVGDIFLEFKAGPGISKNRKSFLHMIRIKIK
jgi:DNA-binding transcriptional MerR regulator